MVYGAPFLRKMAGKRGGCRGAALENTLAAGFPPFLFYSFIFLFYAAEQLNVGTAAGLEDLY